METGDVVRYLGIFLGGGVSGGVITAKLLDHWLTDRRERRVRLRPKDDERIGIVRARAEELYMSTARKLWQLPAEPSPPSVPDSADRAVPELDDKRLTSAWNAFVIRAHSAQLAEEWDEAPSENRWTTFQTVSRGYYLLLQELNRLERRR